MKHCRPKDQERNVPSREGLFFSKALASPLLYNLNFFQIEKMYLCRHLLCVVSPLASNYPLSFSHQKICKTYTFHNYHPNHKSNHFCSKPFLHPHHIENSFRFIEYEVIFSTTSDVKNKNIVFDVF